MQLVTSNLVMRIEAAPSIHIEICHDKEENENHSNAILSTLWGSVSAWREQMLVLGSELLRLSISLRKEIGTLPEQNSSRH